MSNPIERDIDTCKACECYREQVTVGITAGRLTRQVRIDDACMLDAESYIKWLDESADDELIFADYEVRTDCPYVEAHYKKAMDETNLS